MAVPPPTSPTSSAPLGKPRALLALALLAGLQFGPRPAPADTPRQDPLPTITLQIGTSTVQAEVADEPDERITGLMGRTHLAEGAGMLFVFREPRPLGFWMTGTLIPLSIAYVNASGVIREIHDLQPLDKNPARSTFPDLSYALEVPQGWFQRNKILAGDRILGLPAPQTAQPD